jgi:hypothetical protein
VVRTDGTLDVDSIAAQWRSFDAQVRDTGGRKRPPD